MRRIVSASAGFLLLACSGFAAASILNGGSFAAILTGSTGTTATATTGTTSSGRKVTLCHQTGSKKHPFVTIRVSKNAVAAHLRHGDHLGACTTDETKPKKKSAPSSSNAPKSGSEPTSKPGKGKTESGAPKGGNGGNEKKGNEGNGNNGNNGNSGNGGKGKGK